MAMEWPTAGLPVREGLARLALYSSQAEESHDQRIKFFQSIDQFGSSVLRLPPLCDSAFTMHLISSWKLSRPSQTPEIHARLLAVDEGLQATTNQIQQNLGPIAGEAYTNVFRESWEIGRALGKKLAEKGTFTEAEIARAELLLRSARTTSDESLGDLKELARGAIDNIRFILLTD